jgi:CRP/FNR family cyclic AMP-dependent transcriptional regulator
LPDAPGPGAVPTVFELTHRPGHAAIGSVMTRVFISRAIVGKLRSATRRRVEFATCPAPVRVARVLRELIETHGVRRPGAVSIEVALTQPELAALAGATEPTVQRVLSSLREQGVVQTGYRRLRVLDEGGLERLART